MIREQSFFLELLNRISYQASINQALGINLGGTSGSHGGNGTPPGGFQGQLAQTRVAGDTSELFIYTSGSVASLLDNLNNLRAFAKPATWFMPHEVIPASNSLIIMPGVWYYSSGSVLISAGTTIALTPPATNNRIDLLVVNTVGVFDVIRGTTAVTPVAPSIPTSGSMPIAYLYMRSSGSAVHEQDRGESFIQNDIRPLLGVTGSSGGTSMVFDPAVPLPVASVGNVGTSGSASHGDHEHTGVPSVSITGIPSSGSITLVPGTNVTLSQSSGSITINSLSSGSVLAKVKMTPGVVPASPLLTADQTDWQYESSGSTTGNTTFETAYASPPATPADGDSWRITDSFLGARRSLGAWSYYYGSRHVIKPVIGDFSTWYNQGSATLTDLGHLTLYSPAGAGANLRGVTKACAAGSFSAEAILKTAKFGGTNTGASGIFLTDGTQAIVFGFAPGASLLYLNVDRWSTASGGVATSPYAIVWAMWMLMDYWYMRIREAGGTRYFEMSPDGVNYQAMYTEATGAFLTPIGVGLCVDVEGTTFNAFNICLHWKQS